jgi:acyl CoA:acetate/3-ketoacid CoA transferase beta subunit
MDLGAGAKRVWVLMDHTTKSDRQDPQWVI